MALCNIELTERYHYMNGNFSDIDHYWVVTERQLAIIKWFLRRFTDKNGFSGGYSYHLAVLNEFCPGVKSENFYKPELEGKKAQVFLYTNKYFTELFSMTMLQADIFYAMFDLFGLEDDDPYAQIQIFEKAEDLTEI